MAGFAAIVEDIRNVLDRVTLTLDGVLFLARYGHFCKVRWSEIDDRSKADMLAKSLVCFQILWVAGQAIERKISSYPITLLEIHTLVHVMFALIMYALWAKKPQNIQFPTLAEFGENWEL